MAAIAPSGFALVDVVDRVRSQYLLGYSTELIEHSAAGEASRSSREHARSAFALPMPERFGGSAYALHQSVGWQITREGLIDLALLVGTDFNHGVDGIGPKKALKLVQQHGRIEAMPDEIQRAVGDVTPLRQIYLQPAVTDDYEIAFAEPDVDGVVRFLCDEREFSRDRVTSALARAFPPPRLF